MLVSGGYFDHFMPVGDVDLPGSVVPDPDDRPVGAETETVPVAAGYCNHIDPVVHSTLSFRAATSRYDVAVGGDAEGETPPGCDGADAYPFGDIALSMGIRSGGQHRSICSQAEGVRLASITEGMHVPGGHSHHI